MYWFKEGNNATEATQNTRGVYRIDSISTVFFKLLPINVAIKAFKYYFEGKEAQFDHS